MAVALLAALAAALAPTISGAIRVSTRVEAAAARAEDERVGRDVLGDLFDSIVQFDANKPPLALEGSSRALSLTSLADGGGEPATVRLEITAGAVSIIAVENLTLPAQERPNSQSATLVMHDVSRFAYYGAPEEGAPPSWRNEWSGPRPPTLIRIVKAKGPAEDFFIGGRSPLNCAFDPVSRRCR